MAKISNTSAYPNISNLDSADYLILTDAENSLLTKSCTIGALQSFIATGGITLTTTGSSGSSTLIDGVLNIPEYTVGDVSSVNSLTGAVVITASNGLTITETGGSSFNISGANAGNFVSLTVNGNLGAATLISGVLNVPQYQRAIVVTTTGTGAASLVGAQLNIPYDPLTLTTSGNSGLASLTGKSLNIPEYQQGITVTTTGTGAASLSGGNLNIPYSPVTLTTSGNSGAASLTGTALNIPEYQQGITVTTNSAGAASLTGSDLNIPYLNSYNTGTPVVVTGSPAGSSTISTASLSGATVNMYSCTWSGGNGNYTLTLPSAVTDAYRSIRVITDGTFVNNTLQIILTPVFGQTINGVASVALNKQYTGILVWSDGSNWRVIQEIS